MGLVPDLNEKATIKNVRNFFLKEEQYPKICRNADRKSVVDGWN